MKTEFANNIINWVVLQEIAKRKTGRDGISQSFLHCHSEQFCDEYHLVSSLSFFHSLYLSFSYHVHDLISLQGSPRALKGEEAQTSLDEPFNKVMILLDNVIQVLHLSQFAISGETSSCFQFG